MISKRLWCRLCGGRVEERFTLTPTPIANNYSKTPDTEAKRYPLDLAQCSSCGHVQLSHVVEDLFHEYKYTTPRTVTASLESVAKILKERFPQAKAVLEIGSNNGTYLKVLRDHGFNATGIDPAATGPGNIKDYFTKEWARTHGKQYDLILANNVFAHIDNLRDVFQGVEHLLTGALVFEVQYFPSLVDAAAFDMCYHEHMSYHTIGPMAKFLKTLGLVMTKHEFIPAHGGSVRITAEKCGVEALYYEPQIDWYEFGRDVEQMRDRIAKSVRGRKVVLLGAAAKVTTLIHHCGIAGNILFACDDGPEKQGLYIPGTDIEIRPTSELGKHPALLGAWNFAEVWRKRFPNNEFINPYEVTVGA